MNWPPQLSESYYTSTRLEIGLAIMLEFECVAAFDSVT
jgi:hypothetical protein